MDSVVGPENFKAWRSTFQSVLGREDLWNVVLPAHLREELLETVEPSETRDSKGKTVAPATTSFDSIDKDKTRRRETTAMGFVRLSLTDMVKPLISQISDPAKGIEGAVRVLLHANNSRCYCHTGSMGKFENA